jgi:integrase
LQYVNTQKHLKRFLKEKYNVKDILLSQLNLPFIEDFDFYLRVGKKLKPASVNGVIVQLLSAARTALHRNLITHPPFFGYKLTRPEFNIRSLSSGEFERLVSTPIETLSQMMGHKSVKTTQIYAKVTRTKLNEDMTNLAQRIEGKYELYDNQTTIKRSFVLRALRQRWQCGFIQSRNDCGFGFQDKVE